MINIQDLINEKFPTQESREKIKSIQITGTPGQNIETEEKLCLYDIQLEGTFDFKEFFNLESFSLSGQNNSVQVISQQRLTESEKNIIKQMPGIIFAAGNYLSSSNNLHLTRAENFLAEFNKNDLTIKANPNLNEGMERERMSNTRRLANSFKRIIEVCKKLDEDKNLELAQKTFQLEEEKKQLSSLLFPDSPYNFQILQAEIKRLKIQELAPQVRKKREELEQLTNNAKSKLSKAEKYPLEKLLKKHSKILQGDNNTEKFNELKEILSEKLTSEELQTLLNKQKEFFNLEKHLESLQINEQVAQVQQVLLTRNNN